jgi:hypothetical protein
MGEGGFWREYMVNGSCLLIKNNVLFYSLLVPHDNVKECCPSASQAERGLAACFDRWGTSHRVVTSMTDFKKLATHPSSY